MSCVSYRTKREAMKFNLILFVLMVSPLFALSAHIQLIDITPEEAQKLITQQSLDLRYSKKLSESPAAGQSYNGKIIDSDDYTEEIYEANQFHGQDGLGRYIFGYTDNQQARLEARNVNGEVRGQYRYFDPWGNDIEVQYWSDGLGYHQTDNRPKFDLQPVTETPEVKKAREEHERLWIEAARMNGVDVDTLGLYNTNSDTQYDDVEELEGQVSNQHQSLERYPLLPYSKHLTATNADEFGRVADDAVVVESSETTNNQIRSRFARQQQDGQVTDEQQVTSEPRGFFYSFDYPVPFIRSNAAARDLSFEEQQPTNIVEHFAQVEENLTEKVATKNIEVTTTTQSNAELIPAHEILNNNHVAQSRKVNRSVNRGRGSIKFNKQQ